MEVVTIEKRAFSYICERFTEFAKQIESLCSTHTQNQSLKQIMPYEKN